MTTVDPDQNFSNLPQPYRMIAKILEYEILDACWLEITRKHTDLCLNSDGKPIALKRNYNLINICKATKLMESDQNIISTYEIDDVKLHINLLGQLVVYDKISGLLAGSHDIFYDITDMNIEYTSLPYISNAIALPSTDKSSHTKHILVCVNSIFQTIEVEKSNMNISDKKKPTKKTTTTTIESKPDIKRKFQLLLCSIDSTNQLNMTSVKCLKAIHIIGSIEIDLDDRESSEGDTITVDFSLEHKFLAIVTKFSGIYVYSLESLQFKEEDLYGITETDDEVKPDESNTNNGPAGQKQHYISKPLHYKELMKMVMKPLYTLSFSSPILNERPVKTGLFISNHDNLIYAVPKTDQDSDTNHSSIIKTNKNCGIGSEFFDSFAFEMVILFDEIVDWIKIELFPMASNSSTTEVESNDKKSKPNLETASKSKASSITSNAATQGHQEKSYECSIVGTYSCSSAITAYQINQRRTMMLFGMVNGTVVLWNLREPLLNNVFCKHQAPVTAVTFCYCDTVYSANVIQSIINACVNRSQISYPSQSTAFEDMYTNIVSAAVDGTLIFYTAVPHSEYNQDENGQFIKLKTVTQPNKRFIIRDFEALKLNFRQDVLSPILYLFAVPDYPLLITAYENGIVAVYDVETTSLLGQLCTVKKLRTDTLPQPMASMDYILKTAYDSYHKNVQHEDILSSHALSKKPAKSEPSPKGKRGSGNVEYSDEISEAKNTVHRNLVKYITSIFSSISAPVPEGQKGEANLVMITEEENSSLASSLKHESSHRDSVDSNSQSSSHRTHENATPLKREQSHRAGHDHAAKHDNKDPKHDTHKHDAKLGRKTSVAKIDGVKRQTSSLGPLERRQSTVLPSNDESKDPNDNDNKDKSGFESARVPLSPEIKNIYEARKRDYYQTTSTFQSKLFRWSTWRDSSASADTSGFSTFYIMDKKNHMAVYSIIDMLVEFYPSIAAIYSADKGDNMKQLFDLLTRYDRITSHLSRERLMELKERFGHNDKYPILFFQNSRPDSKSTKKSGRFQSSKLSSRSLYSSNNLNRSFTRSNENSASTFTKSLSSLSPQNSVTKSARRIHNAISYTDTKSMVNQQIIKPISESDIMVFHPVSILRQSINDSKKNSKARAETLESRLVHMTTRFSKPCL